MDWLRFAGAVAAAGVACSMTDWLFAGGLFHDHYNAYPEIWRNQGGSGETRSVAWSIVLGFGTCAAFTLAAQTFGLHGWARTMSLALFVWLIGPLPLLVTNALFIKLHPLIVVSNALGWIAKLALAAAATVLILG